MLHALRIVLTLASLAPFAAFRGAFAVRGRDWRVARHGARLALFAVEVALVVTWTLGRFVLRADRAFLPPAAELAAAIAGGALAIGATAFAAWARVTLGRMFSPTFGVLTDHALVTTGPYAVTRHPLYTGIVGWFAGLSLVWNSALTLALAVVVIAPLVAHTLIEERMFAAHFGDAWDAYRRRVPRLAPWPRPHAKAPRERRSRGA